MSNKCTTCKTPLLAAYCGEHDPSWFIRTYKKISFLHTRIKLFFTGSYIDE